MYESTETISDSYRDELKTILRDIVRLAMSVMSMPEGSHIASAFEFGTLPRRAKRNIRIPRPSRADRYAAQVKKGKPGRFK